MNAKGWQAKRKAAAQPIVALVVAYAVALSAVAGVACAGRFALLLLLAVANGGAVVAVPAAVVVVVVVVVVAAGAMVAAGKGLCC